MNTKRTSISLAVLLLLAGIFYTCTAKIQEEECVEERKCECDFDDDDFDLSELIKSKASCSSIYPGWGGGGVGWGIRLTLRPQITICPTEDPEIKALIAKHDVALLPRFLLDRTYTLVLWGENCHICYAREIIRDFLSTGLFECHIKASVLVFVGL